MKISHNIELLAPAGSYEAFEAAIDAGADAVYVGGPDFGARAYAKNFSHEELIRAIHTAHIHNKKLYLTVNTLLKNRELEERLYQSLLSVYEAGLDAVIVQDMGVLQFIRRNFPGLHLHASTQMTITGPEGMKFLEEQGATRVVAARELSLEELSAMHQSSPIEIEAFIHGALCYSFSGQCLMSSMLGGRSGNRGRCAQPCRLSYQVSSADGKSASNNADFCPLSLKDMCTLDLLPDIIQAGVTSLKIEGRMKQPGYTAAVTGMYRKYLDILLNSEEPYHVSAADRQYLLDIFSRGGSCQGYYKQHNGPDMMAFTNDKKSNFLPDLPSHKKEGITGTLILYPDSPAFLEVSCRDIRITASEGEVQFALEHPMSEERILKQMDKLGNTEFQWDSLDIQMGEHIFIPVKTLNELRRNAVQQLEEALCAPMKRTASQKPNHIPSASHKIITEPHLFVSCETTAQAEKLSLNPEVFGMYLYYDAMKSCIANDIQKHKELYLVLPHITRGTAPKQFFETCRTWLDNGMKGFLVRNLESYGMLKELGWQKYCVLDASLYTWNNEAIGFWQNEQVLRCTMPYELNEKELLHRNNSNSEMIIYGNIPLMFSAQCVRKNTLKCDCAEQKMILKDRYDKDFSCVCVCHPWKTGTTAKDPYCYNILYNSIPFGLLKESQKVLNLGTANLRLNFTTESPEKAAKIFQEFAGVYLHHQLPADQNYTKGHFKRGAE